MVFDIRAYQAYTPPSTKGNSDQEAKKTGHDGRRIFLHNIHCELKYLCSEWNTSSPGEKAYGVKDGEDEERNGSRVVFLHKVYDCGPESEEAM
jgi:hypothetical protein